MTTIQAQTEPTSPGGVERTTLRDRIIDHAERALLLLLYVWLAARLIHGYLSDGRLPNLLLLPAEGLVVVFTLTRHRASEISRHPGEWFIAVAATCLPMMVVTGSPTGRIPQQMGGVLLLMGLMIQMHAKFSLGRSFGCVPANRGIKIYGPYRFVRHPIYLGYLLSHLGFLLINPAVWNLLIYAFSDGLQVPRILAEERLLNADPVYREYRSQVRHRLIPGLF